MLHNIGATTSNWFLVDLDEIRKAAERGNILFIVANQQANSKSWFGIPLAAERVSRQGCHLWRRGAAGIERILQRGESISGYEFDFQNFMHY